MGARRQFRNSRAKPVNVSAITRASSDDEVGGWDSWRAFVVHERVRESDAITSFILKPKDGRSVPRHRPGQYLTVLIDVPGRGEGQRTYTISSAPSSDVYRISVKREVDGTVSKWLHDSAPVGTELKVGAPLGDFVLPSKQARPVVLVSAGVGLTPMISMIESVARGASGTQTFYVHGTRDSASHAMGAHVRSLAADRSDISISTFYSRPKSDDVKGRDFDVHGRITVDWLRDHTPADADFMICGPVPFLRDLVSGLAKSGIPSEHIHYEFFGPVDELLKSWPEALDLVPASAAPPSRSESSQAGSVEIPSQEIGEALLHSQADAVIVSDRDGFITLWSPGAERIFGFDQAHAVGQSLDIITPDALRARHWAGYRHTVATGQSRYGAGEILAVPAIRKDGTRISTEFTITMLKSPDGEVMGMIAVLRDVTARFEETRALKKRVAELEARGDVDHRDDRPDSQPRSQIV